MIDLAVKKCVHFPRHNSPTVLKNYPFLQLHTCLVEYVNYQEKHNHITKVCKKLSKNRNKHSHAPPILLKFDKKEN